MKLRVGGVYRNGHGEVVKIEEIHNGKAYGNGSYDSETGYASFWRDRTWGYSTNAHYPENPFNLIAEVSSDPKV